MVRIAISLMFVLTILMPVDGRGKNTDDNGITEPDAISCKYTKVLGSRIPQRICLTDFEWEDRQRAQMEAKRASKNRNSHCNHSATGPC